jgi:hypothetical protein
LLTADHMVACLQTLKLNLAALKLAREVPFALYEALPEFQDSIPEQKGGVKNQMVRCLILKFLNSMTLKTLIFVSTLID